MKQRIAAMLLIFGGLSAPAWGGQTSIVDTATRACLEIRQGSAVESTCNGQPVQQFALTVQTDGYALIANAGVQQCLAGSGGTVSLATCNAADTTQMFKPVPQTAGGYA